MFGLCLKLHFEMESSITNEGMLNGICFLFYDGSYSCSAGVNPSNSCVRRTTQAHCSMERLKLSMIPSQNTKTISAQGNKLCSIKTGLIFPNLSSLKTSRYGVLMFFFFKPLFGLYWLIFVRSHQFFLSREFGGKQVLSSTGSVKERKLGESEQTTEAGQRSKKLNIGYCAENAEKQKLLISNMKRKALEVYILSS